MKITSTAIFKKYARRLIELYFKIHFSWPVWFHIINRKSRTLFAHNRPLLNIMQTRLLNDLNEKGIAVTSLQELFPEQPDLLAELQHYTAEKIKNQKKDISSVKPFLNYLWDKIPVLTFEDPFHRLVLDQKILNVVNSYLGMFANFYILMLNVTIPIPPDAKTILSQRWHRDHEDKKLCKIFLYLNDIDEEAGPFIYVPHSTYGKKWGAYFRQQAPKGIYPQFGEVEKIIPSDQIIKMTGKAGTLLFCDTSGLHKGGYAFSKERIMLTAGYRSRASASEGKVIRSSISLDNAPPNMRYALTSQVPIHLSRILFHAYKKLGKKIE